MEKRCLLQRHLEWFRMVSNDDDDDAVYANIEENRMRRDIIRYKSDFRFANYLDFDDDTNFQYNHIPFMLKVTALAAHRAPAKPGSI